MGMEKNISRYINDLDNNEIETLLSLYYNQEGIIKTINQELLSNDHIVNLLEKKLISSKVEQGHNNITLTEEGFNICESIMHSRLIKYEKDFKKEIKKQPERLVACLVKRVMWKDEISKEGGFINPLTKPYELDENLWYERVLLKDERIKQNLEEFYKCLEKLGFVKNIQGQRWCSPIVENFLKDQYKNIIDLSWSEEDSLKYYYFYYVYAQDQKNLINFAGEGEQYRSMFFGDSNTPPEYWYSSNRSDPRTLLSSLGLSEQRVIEFLQDMQEKDIVNERMYPLSSFSFFSDDEKIFVIRDIKRYMDYLKIKFLSPVVNTLLI